MVGYREILYLCSDPKNFKRSIEAAAHASHHTIAKVQEAAKEHGVSWPLDDSVTNALLKEILFPNDISVLSVYVHPDFPTIHKDLAQSGTNLSLLWTEYCDWCRASNKSCTCTLNSVISIANELGLRRQLCESSTNPETLCKWIGPEIP